MAGEGSQFTLDELCRLITDGKHGDCQDQADSGFYFLSVKDIVGNRLVYEQARQITARDFAETHRRTNLEPGDVLFTNTGTIGRMAIAKDEPRTFRTTFQKSVAILKPNCSLIDPRFLYYLLLYENARLSDLAAGTTQKNLLIRDLKSFSVRVPRLPEQRAIAHILGTLDDKIELNCRMNETLAAMAQALFKSWFVNFDPVRAKAEGRDTGLPGEIADLFPEALEDSELGEEPAGWEVRSFLDFVDLLSGGTPSTSVSAFWNGGIPWVSARDVSSAGSFLLETDKTVSQLGIDNSSTKVLPALTTIITARGTVGRYCLLGRAMAMNQTNYGLRAKSGIGHFFVFFATSQLIAHLRQQAYGTIFDTITTNTFRDSKMVGPPLPVLAEFDRLIGPLMERVLNNEHESRTLAALRDTLLPKLISGEIRVG